MLPTNINEVISELEDIYRQAFNESDRAGYFTALYLRVTKAVRDKIEEGDYFEDNERMEKLDVVFANRYIQAYQQYSAEEPCSECWKVAFDAAKTWPPLVIQHLFIGMNAHIGLDLGIAAATVSPGPEIESLKHDFNKINELLGSLVDTVQDELSQVWRPLKWIDKWMGAKDEALANFAMGIARDAAWQEALDYAPLHNEDEKEQFIKKRDQSVTAFGKKLVKIESVWLSLLLLVVRLMEIGTVRKKLSVLNEGNE
jgi:hypothetical protein